MSDVPISVLVSPSLHPDALANLAPVLDVEGSVGRGAYHDAREALGLAYNTLRAIAEAEASVQAADTSPGTRRQFPTGHSEFLGDLRMAPNGGGVRRYSSADEQFAAAADAAIARATAALDRRLASLQRSAEALDLRVAEALRPTQPLGVQQEVRSHVRGLPDSGRLSFLQAAARAGDRETIGATLAAPPYLSGLTAEQMSRVRDLAAGVLVPRDHAQAGAVRVATEAVERAGGALVQRIPTLEKYRNSRRAEAARRVAALGGRAA